MWCRTSSTTRVRTARGTRSRSRNARPARHRSHRGRGSARRRRSPACRCRGGAPPSGRPVAPAGAASTDRSVWSHRSSPGTLFWGCRAAPRGRARSVRAGRCPRAVEARPTAPGRRAACRARPRSARPRGGRPARPVPDRGQRRRLHAEPERRRQPDGPDHPEGVLLEPRRRLADRAQDAGGDVGAAAVRVDERRGIARSGAPGHRVDREVAARQVDLDRVAELDPVRSPEVGVVVVGPEGRDLEGLAVAADRDGPEPVLVDGPGEQLDEPLRTGVGGQVPVGRPAFEQDVAQRSTDDVCRVPGLPQRPEQIAHGRRDLVVEGGRRRRIGQLRPRNRYERHASLRSSPRYGVNSE